FSLFCFFCLVIRLPPISTLFPYTTLFRSGEVYLYLHGEGKAADASPRGPIEELVRRGHEVLAVDLSGIGESALSSQPTTRRHWSDRKSTRLNSSHVKISYAVFCLKKKKNI